MQAGQLDQEVRLQYPGITNDGGEVITIFRPLPETTWAMVISQTGSEAFEAARTNARATIRVKLRYRDDVQTTWRLIWEQQAYNIKTVDRSARRNGELWLTAEAVNAK